MTKQNKLIPIILKATTLLMATVNASGAETIYEEDWVDTGDFMGLIYTANYPWIFSANADSWMYQPLGEDSLGSWVYWSKTSPEETFDPSNKPEFTKDAVENFKMQMPWNYELEENAEREYPLIVALHGYTEDPNVYYKPCIIGKEDQMKQFPCFYLAPNTLNGWGGDVATWVMETVENLIRDYRIDERRIYLIGFSMGGSGTYTLANSYYDYNGRLFAGIVRVVGSTQTVLHDEIMQNTAVWYHIGREDRASWVDVARECYNVYKNFPGHEDALETEYTSEVYNFPQHTRVLTLDGKEIFRLSEYDDLGHEGYLPFFDPEVVPWIFSQSLE